MTFRFAEELRDLSCWGSKRYPCEEGATRFQKLMSSYSSDQMRYNVVRDCLMVLRGGCGGAKRRVGKLHARQKFSKLRVRESGSIYTKAVQACPHFRFSALSRIRPYAKPPQVSAANQFSVLGPLMYACKIKLCREAKSPSNVKIIKCAFCMALLGCEGVNFCSYCQRENLCKAALFRQTAPCDG